MMQTRHFALTVILIFHSNMIGKIAENTSVVAAIKFVAMVLAEMAEDEMQEPVP